MPLGGILLGALGLEAVVVADSATFVAAALLIAPIAAPHRAALEDAAAAARTAWTAFWHEWLDGLRLVRSERTIAVLFGVLGLMTFGGTMLDPLTVAWVRDVLGGGPQVYALLITVHAAAGIAGTLLVGRFGVRLAPRTLMGWSSVVAGTLLLVKFNVPSLPLAVSLSILGGITSVASSIGVETLVMSSVRDAYRGRVFGSLGATMSLLSLAGAAVGGALAEVVGTVTMLNVASGLTILAGIVVIRAFATRRTAGYGVASPATRPG